MSHGARSRLAARGERPASHQGRRGSWVAVALLALAWPVPAGAHGTVHELIAAISLEIVAAPGQADLYLKRAELHRIHRDWETASADCDRAADLASGRADVDLCRGLIAYEAGRLPAAERFLARALKTQPDHFRVGLTLARTLVALGRPGEAAEAFTVVVRQDPRPDLFVERARALEAAGRLAAARRGLEEGLSLFGPLATLQLCGIEIDLRLSDYESALARVETLQQQTTVQAPWLVKRGEILEGAGRRSEALEAYRGAVADIERLPPHRRGTRAMRTTASEAREAIARIEAGARRPAP